MPALAFCVQLWRRFRAFAGLRRRGRKLAFVASDQLAEAPEADTNEKATRWLPGALEELMAQGVAALNHDEATLAYEAFLRATHHPEAAAQAWFWRGRTAASAGEAVDCLRRALELDPEDAAVEAHLARAQLRLDLAQRVQAAAASAADSDGEEADVRPPFWADVMRVLGGLAALSAAALWITSGLTPMLVGVPAMERIWLRTIVPSLNTALLPLTSNLTMRLPGSDFDVLLSLPFVIGFLFLFISRGLFQRETWARAAALIAAAALSFLGVIGSGATSLSLELYVGLAAAVTAGRLTEQGRRWSRSDLHAGAPAGTGHEVSRD